MSAWWTICKIGHNRAAFCAQALQSQQSRRNAHYHMAHLLAIMTKLMPEWLPEELFKLLHQQWNSPARRARCVLALYVRLCLSSGQGCQLSCHG